MEPITYLLAANIVIWIGFAIYMIFLSSNQKRLERMVRQLERRNG